MLRLSLRKSDDGRSLSILWSALRSEYTGTLDITLHATITVEGDNVLFEMNEERFTISRRERGMARGRRDLATGRFRDNAEDRL